VQCSAPGLRQRYAIHWHPEDGSRNGTASQRDETIAHVNITMALATLVCGLLILVVIGAFLLGLLAIFWAVMIVIGAIKANEGVAFRYPATLRWVR
jgi:uncharacterized Tic20 family protein